MPLIHALRHGCLSLAVSLPLAFTVRAQAPEAPLPVPVDAKIETLLAPLSGAPAIHCPGETLLVELEAAAAADLEGISAALTPSFGQLRPRIELGRPFQIQTGVASRLWPGRLVDRLHYALPAELLPDLYDLEVAAAGVSLIGTQGADSQRRAVSVMAEYPPAARVVILSDTHTGDPRGVADSAEDAGTRGEYEAFIQTLERSLGNPANSERWAAFLRAVNEINLVRPDFVLVTGDLTFENHSTALPYEYEDAWRLLDRLEVPAYVAPGNHDLYSMDDFAGDGDLGLDGETLWPLYFGPLQYSVDIGPGLHLAALNTFEWDSLEPFPVEDEFDTLAAGQVKAGQLAWLRADLEAYRARAPAGVAVTFAHHDPSWQQRRHAWVGEGRLELRDLLAATQVGVHFSGHTHEDRVARYFRGDVVETNGRPHADQPVKTLHLMTRDGGIDLETYSQEQLGAILREPSHGPLFVSTTTVSSELVGDIWGIGGYWGWRLAQLVPRDAHGGLDPADFGYPATDAFLATHAERPESWTADHSQYGLFSYPSFDLDLVPLTANDGSEPRATQQISSRLLAELVVAPRFSVSAAANQRLVADGGSIQTLRYGDGKAEVIVRAVVPAAGQIEVTVRPATADDLPPLPPALETAPTPAVQEEPRDPGRFGGALSGLLLLGLAIAAQARRRSHHA